MSAAKPERTIEVHVREIPEGWVRDAASYSGISIGGADFDQWLAEVRAEAYRNGQQEQERLIRPLIAALLTEHYGGRATFTERQLREAPDDVIVTEDLMAKTLTVEVSM